MNLPYPQTETTLEQTQKLVDLGINHLLADVEDYVPRWSLANLISMLPTYIGHKNLVITNDFVGYMERNADDIHWPFLHKGNIYDSCIACIEWLIKEKYLDKKYLNEEFPYNPRRKNLLDR